MPGTYLGPVAYLGQAADAAGAVAYDATGAPVTGDPAADGYPAASWARLAPTASAAWPR